MNCTRHNIPMIQLFTSWVCDKCEPKKAPIDAEVIETARNSLVDCLNAAINRNTILMPSFKDFPQSSTDDDILNWKGPEVTQVYIDHLHFVQSIRGQNELVLRISDEQKILKLHSAWLDFQHTLEDNGIEFPLKLDIRADYP